ncbi:MAG TPA: hypothetical protein PK874_09995 [Desulfobacteraceae bacterium]|nr:hypothetical protein [Desulfobacteraceae bacterium]HPJ67029.1 hypothetical protein [Desulfobacteraceae bacterium]HPQ27295.1 hypothetical protein [Desulfobacteraceae bacterium]
MALERQAISNGKNTLESMVLYCLLRKKEEGADIVRFLLIQKQGQITFPPTKFRPGEDLYSALARSMEQDLGLSPGSYYPESELEMIPNDGLSPRYPGLPKRWYLYPVDVSVTEDAREILNRPDREDLWLTLDQILQRAEEPNVKAIAENIKKNHLELLDGVHPRPTMDALAAQWAAQNPGGARLLRNGEIQKILESGSRAFNLRVADPYLPYQRQGLGFTWSFFTPKDKQDVHVHGLPAVEIYGILRGRFQIWYKPMNQRGVRMWRNEILGPGDWVEIEPLYCHFGCWMEPEGLGTVFKAAASGELAGVGKIGIAGKTVCKDCNVHEQCALHPRMSELLKEYTKPFEDRDYDRIRELAESAVIGQQI